MQENHTFGAEFYFGLIYFSTGITLSALWLRLENREPEFNLKLDTFSTEAIWTILASSMELKFYKLPSARELPTIPAKIRHRDPVTGIIQVKQEVLYTNGVYSPFFLKSIH